MIEANPSSHELEPKAKDATELAEKYYFARDHAASIEDDRRASNAVDEIMEVWSSYLDFRAKEDPEMGNALVAAFESFQDPDPTMAKLQVAVDMQEMSNRLRRHLGLPELDLPTDLPAADANWSPDRPY